MSVRTNALVCMDQIIERFGKIDLSAVQECVRVLLDMQRDITNLKPLRILSIHCLASGVNIAAADLVPFLRAILEVAYTGTEDSITSRPCNLDYFQASCGLMTAVIEEMPFMIASKSFEAYVRLLARSAVRAPDAIALGESSSHILDVAATKLDLKIVLSATTASLPEITDAGPEVPSQNNLILTCSH